MVMTGQERREATLAKVPAFETLFEQEHVLTERILDCGRAIVAGLRQVPEGESIPAGLFFGMGVLVYLNENFADQAHLMAEEAVIPIAVARGMPAKDAEWVFTDHDQARAYSACIAIAWKRINSGDREELPRAIEDYARCTEGMVDMFVYHAEREDHRLFPEMARYLSEADDDLIMHVIRQLGPTDITPYVALIADMEQALGIAAPSDNGTHA